MIFNNDKIFCFNQISDLSPLKTNPYYKRILDIYLDDNSIESISDIDGTYWLEHFRLLSLRGNKLTAVSFVQDLKIFLTFLVISFCLFFNNF